MSVYIYISHIYLHVMKNYYREETPEEGTPIRRLLKYFRLIEMRDVNPGRDCGNGEVGLENKYSKVKFMGFDTRLWSDKRGSRRKSTLFVKL